MDLSRFIWGPIFVSLRRMGAFGTRNAEIMLLVLFPDADLVV